ncbi:MAG: rhombotarget lipoprotein [Proteobacteria bacterium]|nr:rhombotarget lipoprotein [Pseudomonadota bacterium]
MFRIILILGFLSLSGCAIFGTYQERHLRSTSLVKFLYPQGKLPLTDKKNPVLNLPLRVGLAFIPDASRQTTITPATKSQLLEKVKAAFVGKEYVDEIIIIPEIYLRGSDGYSSLDQVHNLYQLDVIALVSYDQIVNGSDNLLSLSYLTIIGAYIFPGSNYKVSTMIDMAVIDVPSRSILFRSAGTSGSKNKPVAGAYVKQVYRKKQNQGFVQAMQQMQDNLYLELTKFEQRLRKRNPDDKVQVRHREGYTGGSLPFWLFGLLLFIASVKYTRESNKS